MNAFWYIGGTVASAVTTAVSPPASKTPRVGYQNAPITELNKDEDGAGGIGGGDGVGAALHGSYTTHDQFRVQ